MCRVGEYRKLIYLYGLFSGQSRRCFIMHVLEELPIKEYETIIPRDSA